MSTAAMDNAESVPQNAVPASIVHALQLLAEAQTALVEFRRLHRAACFPYREPASAARVLGRIADLQDMMEHPSGATLPPRA